MPSKRSSKMTKGSKLIGDEMVMQTAKAGSKKPSSRKGGRKVSRKTKKMSR